MDENRRERVPFWLGWVLAICLSAVAICAGLFAAMTVLSFGMVAGIIPAGACAVLLIYVCYLTIEAVRWAVRTFTRNPMDSI
jgi:hypothetical protein